jgi:dTDP-4-dehydrorhamnose reductase
MMRSASSPSPKVPELWGGPECTINRVGDRYFDQLGMTGHDSRPRDLDLVAGLGIRTLRYPVLWERVCPSHPDRPDWSFPDERLPRLQELGIRPIVGLIHHGSGPAWTGLEAPDFAERLAAHAGNVARRYPWVDAYTPVNEPLTTARFCGLYGHWHPHGKSDRVFVRALLAQCRATALCMRAIRRINPAAVLVQTEDLGKVHSTPPLAYQAAFENERRWLTFDLLCGKVDRGHPMWDYLAASGAQPADLEPFLNDPCPPDIFGFNHYVTSERFLDHRLERYPSIVLGGNGNEAYADVEAVRVEEAATRGPQGLLREAWDRYRRPMAVTEVHLGCTREDQVRWLRDVWEAALSLNAEGADIRAVTIWSLFGACEWNSLVTRREGHYEPGAFDIRAPAPRPTALAWMAARLASGLPPEDPLSAGPGWWRRSGRFLQPPSVEAPTRSPQRTDFRRGDFRPVLITGGQGTLGRALSRVCGLRGIPHAALDRSQMDIADPGSVDRALSAFRPWAVLNAAGYVRVDEAENEPEKCLRENVSGPLVLAEACSRRETRLVTFSSDLVFDGSSQRPYMESDPVSPLNMYGRSKAQAEQRLGEGYPGALIIRTSSFFGSWDERNFLVRCLAAFRRGETVQAADDLMVSPTYIPDLANACVDLLLDGEKGLWHLCNNGAMNWAGLARYAAEYMGAGPESVSPMPSHLLFPAAIRPRYSVLGSERGWLLPALEDSLDRCLADLTARPGALAEGTSSLVF